jgi:hypothetical protein
MACALRLDGCLEPWDSLSDRLGRLNNLLRTLIPLRKSERQLGTWNSLAVDQAIYDLTGHNTYHFSYAMWGFPILAAAGFMRALRVRLTE